MSDTRLEPAPWFVEPGSDAARIGYMVAAIEVERNEFARALYAICLADKERNSKKLSEEIEKAKELIFKHAPGCIAEKVK
jgi:hypothetical protein